ncbi:hypothetical protein JCM8097_004852 [Rhodosporidiobolus ruineniae]
MADPSQPISTSTSATDLTVHEHHSPTPTLQGDTSGGLKSAKTGLFSQPGTIPLPDHGYHRLGVVFEDVTVYGAGGTRKTVEGLELAMLKMWDVPGFISKLFNLKFGKKRALISGFSGVVPAGETMLVLGRPGSGCSTLLRAITNQRDSFAAVEGEVHYGRLSATEAKPYSGDIVFNSEDDIHQPLLTVEQTLGSALALKKPHPEPVKRSKYAKAMTSRLLNAYGMPHTARTKVGNEYIRGVSGGERKRVSLAEHLSTNAAISAWDNSVRGLDSAVALQSIKVLKELSLSTGMTNIVSIYQASQDMWAYFDRVCVLYEGEMVFMGRSSDAQAFFEEQGWQKNPRQTTPDFLTSCTSPTERKVREGYRGYVPQTPAEMARYFRESPYWTKLQQDIAAYKQAAASSDDTDRFIDSVRKSGEPLTGKNAYKTNFARQVLQLIKAQAQVQIADPRNIVVRLASNAFNAIIVGAVTYKPTPNANGSFAVAGALFFGILYFVIFAFGEIPPTVMGRPLLIKHRTLGFYNPAASVVAQIVADIPLYVLQTLLFSALFYFLVGLAPHASNFFLFWFICFVNYSALAACYRMIGSWSPNLSVAVRYGGFALSLLLSSAGFLLPPPIQLGWTHWLSRVSPPAYALEALLANEFRTRTLSCSASEMVPSGPGYDDIRYQSCTLVGVQPGSASVSGLDYLQIKYGFTPSHIGRNIGIIIAMWIIYSILVVVGSSLLVRDTGSASAKVFKRGAVIPDKNKLTKVESHRQHLNAERVLSREAEQQEKAEKTLAKSDANLPTFTFSDVRYTVQVDGKDKLLLDNVTALVKPGALTALMGASGAGKTTLLDTVSQRKTTGKVEGSFLIDGKPLGSDFARKCAFVMQADIHEPLSTVRECIQFSALLRQDASVSREEKLRYAEEVIQLLELQEIADAIVGNAEIGGLGIEQKKRLTIAVELAAKPDFLLFLDEPTSGLDSQAAYEVVRFLQKIAQTGMAILCTIHQPSGELFEMFDNVVLLAPGGKVVYTGATADAPDYFGRYGAAMPVEANPAEFIISTVAPVGGTDTDWPTYWRESPEASNLVQQIANISSRNSGNTDGLAVEKPSKFAASYGVQTRELIKRNFKAQWRNGSYHLTKLASSVFFGLFIGGYFYQLPSTLGGIQSLSLALLALTQVCPPLALDMAANYLAKFDLFTARERSGIYSWTALVTSLLVVEVPLMLVAFNLLYFCAWWMIGLDVSSEVSGLGWLQYMVLALFLVTFGILLGAVSPSPGSIPFVLSSAWILFNITSMALVPETTESSPFRYFASYLSPLRWFYESLMGNALGLREIVCRADELTTVNIPDGATCASYFASFLESAAGYLVNDAATGSCQYCSMSTGQDYLLSIGYNYAHRWRSWGVFICFAVANIATCFGATWFLRIRPLYK